MMIELLVCVRREKKCKDEIIVAIAKHVISHGYLCLAPQFHQNQTTDSSAGISVKNVIIIWE